MPQSPASTDSNAICDAPSHYVDEAGASTAPNTRTTRTIAALHAALLRLLDRLPFDEITADAIAVEAQVHRATVFRHFTTLRALLDDAAGEQIVELSEFTVSILRSLDGYAAASALFAYVEDHRRVWSALLGGAEGAMRARLNLYSMKLARAEFPHQNDALTSLGVRLSCSIVIDSLVWWLSREPGSVDSAALASIVDKLLTTVQKTQKNSHLMEGDELPGT